MTEHFACVLIFDIFSMIYIRFGEFLVKVMVALFREPIVTIKALLEKCVVNTLNKIGGSLTLYYLHQRVL